MTAQTQNGKIIARLLILVMAMFGFGFALVPLYDVFCDVTGLNGKTGNRVELADRPVVDKSRLIKIQFVANLNASMPWEFKPLTRSIDVHPGEPTTINYYAKNTTNQMISGQAVPSVAPGLAAAYFQKTECFCFTEQKLEAGEEKLMPVIFIIDSSLPEDINELTLSYTFFIKPSTSTHVSFLMDNNNQENKL
ncbi:MAG: cytochrome c oxidase assembly protein [Gammaproteobacteria bacterium]|nr:cytochrome c oxidase assembly protein [Gammaproteobacteria bacterium]